MVDSIYIYIILYNKRGRETQGGMIVVKHLYTSKSEKGKMRKKVVNLNENET